MSNVIQVLASKYGLKEDRVRTICQLTASTPHRVRILAQKLAVSRDTIEDYLHWLQRVGWIERAEGTTYYQLRLKQYDPKPPIHLDRISYPLFRKLPVVKDWYESIDGGRASLKLIKDFYRICSGKVVQSFTCLPEKWTFEETTRDFIAKYCQAFKRTLPFNLLKSLRTFCTTCLNISRLAFRLLVKEELQRNGFSLPVPKRH